MALIDVYCNNDFTVADMEQVIADLALKDADQIFRVNLWKYNLYFD